MTRWRNQLEASLIYLVIRMMVRPLSLPYIWVTLGMQRELLVVTTA